MENTLVITLGTLLIAFFFKFFFCSLIAIAASIGAAGIPGSGIMIIIVLQAVNLPLHDFGIIMAIEWML